MCAHSPESQPLAGRAGCIEALRESTVTVNGARNVSLEEIVREAIDAVRTDNVAPFDAADQAAGRYNYVDVEAVLRLVREGVDRE